MDGELLEPAAGLGEGDLVPALVGDLGQSAPGKAEHGLGSTLPRLIQIQRLAGRALCVGHLTDRCLEDGQVAQGRREQIRVAHRTLHR